MSVQVIPNEIVHLAKITDIVITFAGANRDNERGGAGLGKALSDQAHTIPWIAAIAVRYG